LRVRPRRKAACPPTRSRGRWPPISPASALPVARNRCDGFHHARRADAQCPSDDTHALARLNPRQSTLAQIHRIGLAIHGSLRLNPTLESETQQIGNPTDSAKPHLALVGACEPFPARQIWLDGDFELNVNIRLDCTPQPKRFELVYLLDSRKSHGKDFHQLQSSQQGRCRRVGPRPHR
jgi:hypothetical protein